MCPGEFDWEPCGFLYCPHWFLAHGDSSKTRYYYQQCPRRHSACRIRHFCQAPAASWTTPWAGTQWRRCGPTGACCECAAFDNSNWWLWPCSEWLWYSSWVWIWDTLRSMVWPLRWAAEFWRQAAKTQPRRAISICTGSFSRPHQSANKTQKCSGNWSAQLVWLNWPCRIRFFVWFWTCRQVPCDSHQENQLLYQALQSHPKCRLVNNLPDSPWASPASISLAGRRMSKSRIAFRIAAHRMESIWRRLCMSSCRWRAGSRECLRHFSPQLCRRRQARWVCSSPHSCRLRCWIKLYRASIRGRRAPGSSPLYSHWWSSSIGNRAISNLSTRLFSWFALFHTLHKKKVNFNNFWVEILNETYHIDQLQENEVHCNHYMIARVFDRPDELVVAFEQVFDKLFFSDRTLQVFDVKQAINKNEFQQQHWRATWAFADEWEKKFQIIEWFWKFDYTSCWLSIIEIVLYARIIHFCK